MARRRLAIALTVAVALGALHGGAAHAARQQTGTAVERVADDGRAYTLYVPSRLRPGTRTPLVVMLHGCTQDRDDFARGTQMSEVAEREGFLVAYPEQPRTAHSNKCWRWFDAAHQSRGSGEPASLAGVVSDIAGDYRVDSRRVSVAGLSAGGAMSVVMGATYPDVFAAVGVGAGLEYKAGENDVEGVAALPLGGPSPDRQGEAAFAAMGDQARAVPVIVFHGTQDTTVAPVNGDQVVAQWAQTNDLASDGVDDDNVDAVPEQVVTGQVPGGRSFTHSRYADRDRGPRPVQEYYTVDGMGHTWSGGSSAGSYTDPTGPDASALMWRFFAEHPLRAGKHARP